VFSPRLPPFVNLPVDSMNDLRADRIPINQAPGLSR
jgi:hypothetical protein